MLARYLRIGAAIELLAALALAHGLVQAGTDRWLAIGLAACCPSRCRAFHWPSSSSPAR